LEYLCRRKKQNRNEEYVEEPGTREKVSSGRINLEGKTHAQESNASQLPV
jgi:hypothetical protein